MLLGLSFPIWKVRVGVTRTRDKYFVVPDPDGDIVMADGAKFSQSTDPTGFVFLRFQLDLDDASSNTLRETGMFVGTKLAEGVPGGQMFIPVADVVDLGKNDRGRSVFSDRTRRLDRADVHFYHDNVEVP